jgi:flagellar biosynthesis/type III secretory pathway M-ring protein FliF/YscJ
MSFRHLKETSEKYDPDGKVVLREAVMSSKMSAVAAARGPVGAVSNIPPSPPPPAVVPVVPGPAKNEETIESEYAVSRVNRSQEEQQGVIDRLTVAVMLIPPPGAANNPPEDVLGITPDEARQLVKQAVGFKDGRDQIQVSIGKVPGEAAAEAPGVKDIAIAGLGSSRSFVSILRGSSLGIAALIAVAMVYRGLRRKSATASGTTPSPAFASAQGLPAEAIAELSDLHAVVATIKAWLDEPAVIRFERTPPTATPQAKPA